MRAMLGEWFFKELPPQHPLHKVLRLHRFSAPPDPRSSGLQRWVDSGDDTFVERGPWRDREMTLNVERGPWRDPDDMPPQYEEEHLVRRPAKVRGYYNPSKEFNAPEELLNAFHTAMEARGWLDVHQDPNEPWQFSRMRLNDETRVQIADDVLEILTGRLHLKDAKETSDKVFRKGAHHHDDDDIPF